MNHRIHRIIALLLVMASLLTVAGCGKSETGTVDGRALFQVLLQEVSFDTPISDKGDEAYLYFSGLPENAAVTLYTGSAYYADALALICVEKDSDISAAETVADNYLAQLRNQYASYLPEQVVKIDNAVVWKQSPYIIVCVTADSDTAQDIVDHAEEKTAGVEVVEPDTEPTEPPSSNETEADTQQKDTEPVTTEPATEPVEEYPKLTSENGTFYVYGDAAYYVDHAAYEIYLYDKYAAENYAKVVNKAVEELDGHAQVYVMAIPTAIGVVFPDDMVDKVPDYSNQRDRMFEIYDMIDDRAIKVDAMHNLLVHRDEYLYFRTDSHWTAVGAYYAYEALCQVKGIEPYTLEQREMVEFDGFRGFMYYKISNMDSNLKTDTIYAYYPYSRRVSMVFTDRDGEQHKWNIITDVSDWKDDSKYNTFAGGDNPITVYSNPDVSDVKVGLVIKESFGNAMIPYLVDHYTVLYEIDYRYWNGDIAEFAIANGVDDVIFVNNMSMIRSGVLVGMLADNF